MYLLQITTTEKTDGLLSDTVYARVCHVSTTEHNAIHHFCWITHFAGDNRLATSTVRIRRSVEIESINYRLIAEF